MLLRVKIKHCVPKIYNTLSKLGDAHLFVIVSEVNMSLERQHLVHIFLESGVSEIPLAITRECEIVYFNMVDECDVFQDCRNIDSWMDNRNMWCHLDYVATRSI